MSSYPFKDNSESEYADGGVDLGSNVKVWVASLDGTEANVWYGCILERGFVVAH